MQGLLCRLRQNPAILERYDRTIKEQLEKGVIETVQIREKDLGRVHYLPHHAVVRSDKTTTKLRIVYDASAKSNGPSLNECLHKGPKFNQLIFDLLLRFRSYPIALTADVEKAFLMLQLMLVTGCHVIYLDRRYNQGQSRVTSVPICQSCVWRILKPLPTQCHDQVSLGWLL